MTEIKKVTEEMRKMLRKPLDSAAISKHPTKSYLSSIKTIYMTERLNDVFGTGAWQLRTEVVQQPNEKGMVVVKTILTIPDYGIYYESFGGNDNGGSGNKNFDLGDAYKGATTDGVSKICSYLEIGIDVFKGHGDKPQQTNQQRTTTPPPQQSSGRAIQNAGASKVEEERNGDELNAIRQTLLDLLDKPEVPKEAADKMRAAIPTLNEARLRQAIEKVTNTIRENGGEA